MRRRGRRVRQSVPDLPTRTRSQTLEVQGLLALITRYHEALREAVMAQQVWTVEQAEAWINHQIWEREE